MREIKFRAWDKTRNEYLSGGRVLISVEPGNNPKSYPSRDRFILEQYTGLKDKNGREIYEGDIIKSINRDEYCDEVTITERIEVVESLNKYIETLLWIPCHGEIIGNIHENPELLHA
jgi:uncharacterized phage protein (TIGR01671 family)